ncbi:zinc finger protein 830 [Thalassophryne amazonica]|uniref:zinc finger protein 830 n=1 Tax=Thalassophryne amazonica TaxID=390379 RepID=UPI00147227F8|nr:zinc finger protein 830 [Thalassophryne amazonica]
MSSSKKAKKLVNQEELRRLMREKQRQSNERKRVESPFAKYNSLGHLSCVLCSVQVKSELLWPAHVLGKQHKEKVSELNESKQTPHGEAEKRKAAASGAGSEDVGGKKAKLAMSAGAAPGLSLLAGIYDDDEDEGEQTRSSDPPKDGAGVGDLPADFFDSSVPSASRSVLQADAPEKSPEKKANTAEALPEGFFDDPVRDAKVRNVDAPKDQLDKEWEEFQKEIRQVNTKSDAIVAEEDEEGRLERQIDEIDEQIECYKRVELLRDKRDLVKRKDRKEQEEPMETDAEGVEEQEEDEEELLSLLSRDWRAKGALA